MKKKKTPVKSAKNQKVPSLGQEDLGILIDFVASEVKRGTPESVIKKLAEKVLAEPEIIIESEAAKLGINSIFYPWEGSVQKERGIIISDLPDLAGIFNFGSDLEEVSGDNGQKTNSDLPLEMMSVKVSDLPDLPHSDLFIGVPVIRDNDYAKELSELIKRSENIIPDFTLGSSDAQTNNSEVDIRDQEEWQRFIGRWKKMYEKVFRTAIETQNIDVDFKKREDGTVDVDMSSIGFLRRPKRKKGNEEEEIKDYNFIIPMLKGLTLRTIFNRHRELFPHADSNVNLSEKLEKEISSPRNADEKSYVIWVIVGGKEESFEVLKIPEADDREIIIPRGCRTVEEGMMLELLRLYETIEASGMKFEEYQLKCFGEFREYDREGQLGRSDFSLSLNYFIDGNGKKEAMVSVGWYDTGFAIKRVVIRNNFNTRYLRMHKAYRVWAEERHHFKLEIIHAPL